MITVGYATRSTLPKASKFDAGPAHLSRVSQLPLFDCDSSPRWITVYSIPYLVKYPGTSRTWGEISSGARLSPSRRNSVFRRGKALGTQVALPSRGVHSDKCFPKYNTFAKLLARICNPQKQCGITNPARAKRELAKVLQIKTAPQRTTRRSFLFRWTTPTEIVGCSALSSSCGGCDSILLSRVHSPSHSGKRPT